MSDILVCLSSESLSALKDLVRERGWTIHWKVWGDGHEGESLRDFLDSNLSEMAYDESCHIVTEVVDVKLASRCPYRRDMSKKHAKCGWMPEP